MRKLQLIKCPICGAEFDNNSLSYAFMICEKCNHYFRMPAINRIKLLCDCNSFCKIETKYVNPNPISFPNYELTLEAAIAKNKLDSSVITGTSKINNTDVVMIVFDSYFIMGSIGCSEGELTVQAIEYAIVNKMPIILVIASAGSRLQEGIFSLMQMAKISAAMAKHNEAKLLSISILTDPIIGGASLNLAMNSDIVLSEPNVKIGLAGKRILNQTIYKNHPANYQTSEAMLTHGFLDKIVQRNNLRTTIGDILAIHSPL